MCCTCWNDYGSPTIDNEKVRAIVPLIDEVYLFHGAGGNLHIVLDDNNIEDGCLDFCGEQIMKARATQEWSPEQLDAEQACLDAMKELSLDERASALGLWNGCWK